MPSLFAELRRRNVFKVGAAYAIVAWLLIEVASTVFPIVQLPEWTVTFVTMLLLLGFPVALVLSWAYEITPEGIQKTRHVPLEESITHITGQKLNYIVTALLVLAVVFLVVDNYVLQQQTDAPETVPDQAAASSEEGTNAVSMNRPDRRSIAALPFSNESAAEENAEFFANGIHDNLLTQLAKLSALKVISRTSVMEYRDSPKNMRQIGQELGVATILEGGVQRAGDAVQINVQLIDAETDQHIWAETYDRQLTAENIFAIQREIAISIAETLEATLLPDEVAQLNEVPTDNIRALDFYLSGNEFLRGTDNETVYSLAARQFERSVREDPQFALAWAALARAYSGRYFFADGSEETRELARRALERAFQLDADLPEAHLANGYYSYHGFRNYEAALENWELAESEMSGDAQLHQARAYVYRRMGEFEQSLASMDRALELDPRNVEALGIASSTAEMLRDYSRAERYIERQREIASSLLDPYLRMAMLLMRRDGDTSLARAYAEIPPVDLETLRQYLGWIAALYDRDLATALQYLDDWAGDTAYYEAGGDVPKALLYAATNRLLGETEVAAAQYQSARRQLESELEERPSEPFLLLALGESLVGLGEIEDGLAQASQAMEQLSKEIDALTGSALQRETILRVYAPAGAADRAIEELDSYLGAPGYWSIEGLLPDPRLGPIRDTPAFQALVEKYRRR